MIENKNINQDLVSDIKQGVKCCSRVGLCHLCPYQGLKRCVLALMIHVDKLLNEQEEAKDE